MSEARKKIFAPLAEAIREQDFTLANVIRALTEGVNTNARLATAMLHHTADIIEDHAKDVNQHDNDAHEVMVEVYWRTFFDDAASRRYHTNYFDSDELLARYVTDMIAAMKDDQSWRSSFMGTGVASRAN